MRRSVLLQVPVVKSVRPSPVQIPALFASPGKRTPSPTPGPDWNVEDYVPQKSARPASAPGRVLPTRAPFEGSTEFRCSAAREGD